MTGIINHRPKNSKRTSKKADEPSGHGKRMNSRQAMDTHGSGARIRFRHHQLAPNQYRSGGPWARGKIGYGLAVGRRGKPILGFLLKLFWGKCSARMTCHPKKGKMSWNH